LRVESNPAKSQTPQNSAALHPVGEPAQFARMVLLSTLRVGGPALVGGEMLLVSLSVFGKFPFFCSSDWLELLIFQMFFSGQIERLKADNVRN